MGEASIHPDTIPIADLRYRASVPAIPTTLRPASGLLTDALGRPLRDLRISVTDRCNFRCSYCMPKEVFDRDYAFLPHSSLLSFEEITRLSRLFVAHGVRKIRLTGGEPLLRRHLENLVEQLAALRTPDGEPLDLTLTTNGSLLARKAQALADAGLQAHHGQPRRARRRDLPAHERRRLSGGRCAGGHRRGAGCRPRPDQGQHGRQARHQRHRDRADGAPLPRAPRRPRRAALHRVHGRRQHQRLAHGRRAAVGRGDRAPRRGVSARTAAGAGRRRNRRALALPRRRRRRSA